MFQSKELVAFALAAESYSFRTSRVPTQYITCTARQLDLYERTACTVACKLLSTGHTLTCPIGLEAAAAASVAQPPVKDGELSPETVAPVAPAVQPADRPLASGAAFPAPASASTSTSVSALAGMLDAASISRPIKLPPGPCSADASSPSDEEHPDHTVIAARLAFYYDKRVRAYLTIRRLRKQPGASGSGGSPNVARHVPTSTRPATTVAVARAKRAADTPAREEGS